MAHWLPEAGLEVPAGARLHEVAARDLKPGDIVLRSYVRKVAEIVGVRMGYIVLAVEAPDDIGWHYVGQHQYLPEATVMVLRAEAEYEIPATRPSPLPNY